MPSSAPSSRVGRQLISATFVYFVIPLAMAPHRVIPVLQRTHGRSETSVTTDCSGGYLSPYLLPRFLLHNTHEWDVRLFVSVVPLLRALSCFFFLPFLLCIARSSLSVTFTAQSSFFSLSPLLPFPAYSSHRRSFTAPVFPLSRDCTAATD